MLLYTKSHTYEFRCYGVREIAEPRVFNCVPLAERTRFLTGLPDPK